ncbi:MAG: RagB/SusD family nutrient uptake outer membrane protein [Mediterranea sp.]|jgi:hypothetical protein|nr:RagB/SusD family nutrient uptake outer membrane protein [Mediterranea sp.]
MKLLRNTFYIGLLTVATLNSSCRGDLMDLNPYDKVASGSMWKNEALADQGVISIYSQLRIDNNSSSSLPMSLVLESLGASTDCRDSCYTMFFGYASGTSGMFRVFWQKNYEGVMRANDAINNLDKAGMPDSKYKRLLAESKFLRAWFYYQLNSVFHGVPYYTEMVSVDELTLPRLTDGETWQRIVDDLTDCVVEVNLPDRYESGNANYGRVTKGAAYALRGKVYLWMNEWDKAEADFKKVGDVGYTLYTTGTYKSLFKEANEQCPEMIFSMQCIGQENFGNTWGFRYGTRGILGGGGWDTFFPNTDFVDSYENADGSKFNWDDIIPGYNAMPTTTEKAVYFLRDDLSATEEESAVKNQNVDMSKYIKGGNEARIKKAYENRDPRLTQTIITPYSNFFGTDGTNDYNYTMRWPYRGNAAPDLDLKSDQTGKFYYYYRKFVPEGLNEIPNRYYSPIDIPLIRYADVLLNRAEAINEQGFKSEAVDLVNLVRNRAGVAPLQSTDPSKPTYVNSQADMRLRIQNERRWELAGEGITYFDELRWRTWKDVKFGNKGGVKEIWGTNSLEYNYAGDYLYNWAIPSSVVQMNPNVKQNDGWIN